jgi:hypothetical protein
MLPNFIFIGPDKSGSTWLQARLSTHPQVFLPAAKDTYFFGAEFGRGLPWYENHFTGAGPQHVIVGEICHDYLFDPAAADRILDLIPKATLMVCLREPVERAVSAYLNMRRNGWEIGTFDQAAESHPELLDHSRYAKHLSAYLDRFPVEQIVITWFDELAADPQGFLDSVTAALGIDRQLLTESEKAPARAAAQARWPAAARVAKRGAIIARQMGMADLIGRIKSSDRVQTTLYRPMTGSTPALDEVETARVRAQLEDDVRQLERLLGTDLHARWGW